MAFTYGFYNSINGDRRYDAQQMSAIFDGIITDGVFSSVGGIFATVPGEGMTVVVKSGRAWFDHTWSYNDGAMPLSIQAADVTLKRYDAVVLEVNNTESVRENAIKVIKGTPATNPAKPGMTNTETVHQHPLAYVLIDPGATSITADKIDIRVGQSDCPFSTAILQTVSITDLFNAWESEFDQWFTNVQAQLEGNIVTNLQKQIDDRVKIADKATSADLASATPNKWVDAAGLKESMLDGPLDFELIDRYGPFPPDPYDSEARRKMRYSIKLSDNEVVVYAKELVKLTISSDKVNRWGFLAAVVNLDTSVAQSLLYDSQIVIKSSFAENPSLTVNPITHRIGIYFNNNFYIYAKQSNGNYTVTKTISINPNLGLYVIDENNYGYFTSSNDTISFTHVIKGASASTTLGKMQAGVEVSIDYENSICLCRGAAGYNDLAYDYYLYHCSMTTGSVTNYNFTESTKVDVYTYNNGKFYGTNFAYKSTPTNIVVVSRTGSLIKTIPFSPLSWYIMDSDTFRHRIYLYAKPNGAVTYGVLGSIAVIDTETDSIIYSANINDLMQSVIVRDSIGGDAIQETLPSNLVFSRDYFGVTTTWTPYTKNSNPDFKFFISLTIDADSFDYDILDGYNIGQRIKMNNDNEVICSDDNVLIVKPYRLIRKDV